MLRFNTEYVKQVEQGSINDIDALIHKCKDQDKLIKEKLLSIACLSDRVDIIHHLCSMSNIQLEHGLHASFRSGNKQMIDLMLTKMKECKQYIFWEHMIGGACYGGHWHAIQQCMDNITSNDFSGGFVGACQGRQWDVIHDFIEKGYDYYKWGLFGACQNGHLDVVEFLLLKMPVDGNHLKEYLNKSLEYTLQRKHQPHIIRYLISKGADDYKYVEQISTEKKWILFDCGMSLKNLNIQLYEMDYFLNRLFPHLPLKELNQHSLSFILKSRKRDQSVARISLNHVSHVNLTNIFRVCIKPCVAFICSDSL